MNYRCKYIVLIKRKNFMFPISKKSYRVFTNSAFRSFFEKCNDVMLSKDIKLANLQSRILRSCKLSFRRSETIAFSSNFCMMSMALCLRFLSDLYKFSTPARLLRAYRQLHLFFYIFNIYQHNKKT